jgi:alginate export protein
MHSPPVFADFVRSGNPKTLVAAAVLALLATPALGQEGAKPPGLPEGVDWTFNFDATLGAFGFADSLYTNPKPEEPSGDLSDNWMEGSIKPALTGVFTTSRSSQWYGKFSGVGEHTFSAPPSLVGDDASSSDVEDLYIGWRSGTSFGSGENVLDFTLGRAPYNLGHGLLLWDGAAEGGSRGGYWTNARKAFEAAAIGRFKPGNHTLEGFWLDKDDLPEADSDSETWGVNYEYAFGEDTTVGVTYMNWSANPAEAPQRDGLDVYNLRVFAAPFADKGITVEAEYALEDNGLALDSTAWNALVGYQLEDGPKFSYRYAIFEGDDPATPANEGFDGLLTGFYDWGTWWQGEIAGEYFVANSNLISHQFRVHMTPRENVSMGFMYFDFRADNPASYGPGITSDDIAQEVDWYMDWSVNDHITVSFVAAVAEPGEAVEQSSGRNDTFIYGMAFVAYKY